MKFKLINDGTTTVGIQTVKNNHLVWLSNNLNSYKLIVFCSKDKSISNVVYNNIV